MGTSLADVERVLDFGCGCGRTLRWLMEIYPSGHFFGADVDADAIEWCARNLRGGEFVHTRPEPPLPFKSGYFDVVCCFSVFTHLDERLQDIWLREIKRILKPGGIVILTVHGERAAATLDEQAAGLLRSAGFLHRRSRKLYGIVPDWYNTSWHSQAYIVARLGGLFTDVRYTVVPDGMQDMVAARN
jgi:SAM-dependent methyltransferase